MSNKIKLKNANGRIRFGKQSGGQLTFMRASKEEV